MYCDISLYLCDKGICLWQSSDVKLFNLMAVVHFDVLFKGRPAFIVLMGIPGSEQHLHWPHDVKYLSTWLPEFPSWTLYDYDCVIVMKKVHVVK